MLEYFQDSAIMQYILAFSWSGFEYCVKFLKRSMLGKASGLILEEELLEIVGRFP